MYPSFQPKHNAIASRGVGQTGCTACQEVGATASASARARFGDKEVQVVNLYGQTPSMADIGTRAVEFGRHVRLHREQVLHIGIEMSDENPVE